MVSQSPLLFFDSGGLGLRNNPLFGAGFGLMLMGAGLAVARSLAVSTALLARKRLLTTLEITSKDPGYRWVLQWIRLNALSTRHQSLETTFHTYESGRVKTSFRFVPSVGHHLIKYVGWGCSCAPACIRLW
jgi:chaperone BCS1